MTSTLLKTIESTFHEEVRAFRGFGPQTQSLVDGGIPYLVNEFWTSRQRQAHSIHEISYRACFKPQLPEFFISRLTRPGEGVYDPFMGRGTTAVQAALQNRRPMGNDVNPLSLLLTRPRLAPPPIEKVEARLRGIPWSKSKIVREDLFAFYHESTLRQLCSLRDYLLEHAPLNEYPDPVDDWIRMVALNRLTGHSPGFFSVYSLPPNQAVSVEAQRKINIRRNQSPPPRDVPALILKKSRALLADSRPAARSDVLLGTGDAWDTPYIGDRSVRLIVTSPPFLDVIQYSADNWLRNWFAGIDESRLRIATHRCEVEWMEMVRRCFVEFARLLAPGGHVAFEVGEVRGGKVLLERLVWRAIEGLPFERLFVLINEQRFTKTSNCWGVSNNSKGTNTNRVVVMRRV